MSFTAVDDAPIGRFHVKLAAACSGGPLLDGYSSPSSAALSQGISAAITFVGFLACVARAEETCQRSLEDIGAAPTAELLPSSALRPTPIHAD